MMKIESVEDMAVYKLMYSLTHISYATDIGQLHPTVHESLRAKYEDGLHQLANLITSIERKIAIVGKSKPSILRDEIEEYMNYELEQSK